MAIADYLLLLIENLLAVRVVFSYLGSQNTFVHLLTDYILLPLNPLIARTTLLSDSSRFEAVTALLVIALFYLHKALDAQRRPEEVC